MPLPLKVGRLCRGARGAPAVAGAARLGEIGAALRTSPHPTPEAAPAFNFGAGGWRCEEVPLADLAARYGTPLYCYSRARLLSNYRRLAKAFPAPARICYSVKANPNLSILRELAAAGAGFDVVSEGELWRVLRAGGAASRTVFAGVGKTRSALEAAIDAGLFMLNVESLGELGQILDLAGGVPSGHDALPVALRVNPDVDPGTHRYITTGKRENKFGLERDSFRTALDMLRGARGVHLAGIHAHIGSQVGTTTPYAEAVERLLALVAEAREAGFAPEWVNAGGGFALSYDGTEVPSPAAYAAAILPPLAEAGLKLVLEIGRAIAGDAGALVTRVLYVKEHADRTVWITDAGMNDLLRPSLYGAWHRIWPAHLPESSGAGEISALKPVDVAGPICESSDYFALGRPLPPVHAGDCLAVFDTGAYGMSMASQYNSHPRPAEVLVDGCEVRLIRRRETLEDLVRGEEV
ncbi:MAG: diaminopimelate decarboxylase [Gemmatimonadetes bacterium]|nr:diaminopimelate decarboxylase [Gemmatimonadota bacterium]